MSSSSRLFESTIAGSSRPRTIDGIISDLVESVVLKNSNGKEVVEEEQETEAKEEFSSFSLTSTTSGEFNKGNHLLPLLGSATQPTVSLYCRAIAMIYFSWQ